MRDLPLGQAAGVPSGGTASASVLGAGNYVSGIIPWAVTNTTNGTTLSDFVTYDSLYGVRTLTSYAANLALYSGVAQIVKLTTADSINNNNCTANSLILANTGGSMTQTINGTLAVNSGALLLTPGIELDAIPSLTEMIGILSRKSTSTVSGPILECSSTR